MTEPPCDLAQQVRDYLARYNRIVPDVAPAPLVDALSILLARHHPHPLYTECGHRHEEGDEGVVDVEDVGYVCAEGYQHDICESCCFDICGQQDEHCAGTHDHARGHCPTVVTVIADALGIGGGQ